MECINVKVPAAVTPEMISRLLSALMGEPDAEPQIIECKCYPGELWEVHLPGDHLIRYHTPTNESFCLFMPRSNCFWLEIAIELVKLTGGSIEPSHLYHPIIDLPHRPAEDFEHLDLLAEHIKPVKKADARKWARYVAYPKE